MTINLLPKSWVPSDAVDIQNLLRKYDEWNSFKNNKLICNVCSKIVSFSNLGAAVEDDNLEKIVLICNKSKCLNSYFRKRSEEYY